MQLSTLSFLPMPPSSRPENGVVYISASLLSLFINPLPVQNRERWNKENIGARKIIFPMPNSHVGQWYQGWYECGLHIWYGSHPIALGESCAPNPNPRTCGKIFQWISHSSAGGLLMTVNFTGFSLGHHVYRTAVSEEGTDERVQALVPTYASLFTNIP